MMKRIIAGTVLALGVLSAGMGVASADTPDGIWDSSQLDGHWESCSGIATDGSICMIDGVLTTHEGGM